MEGALWTDWMTGEQDNGNEWRKYRAILRAHPCVPVCTYFNRSGNKGAFRLPGATLGHFRCTVEPASGHIRCRNAVSESTVSTPNSVRFCLTEFQGENSANSSQPMICVSQNSPSLPEN